MSIAYANCPGIPSFGGFELSTETGSLKFFEIDGAYINFDFSQWFCLKYVVLLVAERTNLIGADSQQIKDFVCSLYPASESGKIVESGCLCSFQGPSSFEVTTFKGCLDIVTFVIIL